VAAGPFVVAAPVFLLPAGRILVDGALHFFAKQGLEGSATVGPVQAFLFGPTGVLACKVAEFHRINGSLP